MLLPLVLIAGVIYMVVMAIRKGSGSPSAANQLLGTGAMASNLNTQPIYPTVEPGAVGNTSGVAPSKVQAVQNSIRPILDELTAKQNAINDAQRAAEDQAFKETFSLNPVKILTGTVNLYNTLTKGRDQVAEANKQILFAKAAAGDPVARLGVSVAYADEAKAAGVYAIGQTPQVFDANTGTFRVNPDYKAPSTSVPGTTVKVGGGGASSNTDPTKPVSTRPVVPVAKNPTRG